MLFIILQSIRTVLHFSHLFFTDSQLLNDPDQIPIVLHVTLQVSRIYRGQLLSDSLVTLLL